MRAIYLDAKEYYERFRQELKKHAAACPMQRNITPATRVDSCTPVSSNYRVGSGRLLRRRDSLLICGLHLWESIELLECKHQWHGTGKKA